jgi:hypothetical protein
MTLGPNAAQNDSRRTHKRDDTQQKPALSGESIAELRLVRFDDCGAKDGIRSHHSQQERNQIGKANRPDVHSQYAVSPFHPSGKPKHNSGQTCQDDHHAVAL